MDEKKTRRGNPPVGDDAPLFLLEGTLLMENDDKKKKKTRRGKRKKVVEEEDSDMPDAPPLLPEGTGEDNPSIEDDEWDAQWAAYKKRQAKDKKKRGNVTESKGDYRRLLYLRLINTAFHINELRSHELRVALETDEACDSVEGTAIFSRLNSQTMALHGYIKGFANWIGGSDIQRRIHAASDWSTMPTLTLVPLTVDEIIRIWQDAYGVTFAAAIIPLRDPLRQGFVLFVFEWYDVVMKGEKRNPAGSASEVVAVGVMLRLTPHAMDECMKLFDTDIPTNAPLSAFSPVCEVISRLWLVPPEPGKPRNVAALKKIQFKSTGCSFDAIEIFREKARFYYQTTCLVDSDLPALQNAEKT